MLDKTTLNGNTTLGNEALGPDQAECVKLLKQVLADAERGTIRSVVVVVAGPAGPGAAFAGPDVGALNLGIDAAKQTLLSTVLAPRQKSAILRPGRG